MWWGKPPPMEEDDPPFVRVASVEFVEGLKEIASFYEAREKSARASVVKKADELSRKERFNYRELEEQYINEMRGTILDAITYKNLAAEIRGWIRDYEDRGRRPSYLPKPTPAEDDLLITSPMRRTP